MADNINYIPQVDYTSKDYTAIRNDLINLIPQYTPNWTSRDASDLGMTLIELFSYMGDLMNFYTDRAANEGFLATASQRTSILQLAQMLGYVPSATSPATVTLTFSNTDTVPVTVTTSAKVATTTVVNGLTKQIIFQTDADVTIPAKSGSTPGTANVTATQGISISETIGISSGGLNQTFKLSNNQVVSGSISFRNSEYTYISSLMDADRYDTFFTTQNDSEGYTYIQFGDGINGAIPPAGVALEAGYRISDGAAGNVIAGSLTNSISTNSYEIDVLPTVTNILAASGGADEETTDSIRLNAPRAFRALTRAISLKDYAYLSLQVEGVSKAIAAGDTLNSVILYIAPNGDAGVSAGVPTAAFTVLSNSVALYFTDKTPPNASLTILPPTYVPVNIDITVYVLPQYTQATILSKVNLAISELFSIDNSFFADVIPVQYILNAIGGVNGVDYATVDHLRKNGNEQTFTVSSYTRTSNVATITTSATHNITVGQKIKVTKTNNGGNNVNTTSSIVTAVGSTTISYANTGGNLTATTPTVTATVRASAVETISCAVNEIPSNGTFTISGVGGIS